MLNNFEQTSKADLSGPSENNFNHTLTINSKSDLDLYKQATSSTRNTSSDALAKLGLADSNTLLDNLTKEDRAVKFDAGTGGGRIRIYEPDYEDPRAPRIHAPIKWGSEPIEPMFRPEPFPGYEPFAKPSHPLLEPLDGPLHKPYREEPFEKPYHPRHREPLDGPLRPPSIEEKKSFAHIDVVDWPKEFKANQPDGSMQVIDDKGVKTYWPNGAVNVKNYDGTGYAYNPDPKADGGYTYKHWGPKAEDNYEGTPVMTQQSVRELLNKSDKVGQLDKGVSNATFAKDFEFQRQDDVVNQPSRFEGAHPIFVVEAPAEFKANQPDGSMQVTNDKGVFTYWPNGSVNVRRFDGTGYSYNPDGKGGYDYKHWGQTDGENYSSKYDKATDSIEEVDAHGALTTRWNNGSVLCKRPDGTGYSKHYTRSDMTETKYWGPEEGDNYTHIYNTGTHIGTIWGKNPKPRH